MAPTRTGKMGRHLAVKEKSWNFKQTGKVRKKLHKILIKSGDFRHVIYYF